MESGVLPMVDRIMELDIVIFDKGNRLEDKPELLCRGGSQILILLFLPLGFGYEVVIFRHQRDHDGWSFREISHYALPRIKALIDLSPL